MAELNEMEKEILVYAIAHEMSELSIDFTEKINAIARKYHVNAIMLVDEFLEKIRMNNDLNKLIDMLNLDPDVVREMFNKTKGDDEE